MANRSSRGSGARGLRLNVYRARSGWMIVASLFEAGGRFPRTLWSAHGVDLDLPSDASPQAVADRLRALVEDAGAAVYFRRG